MADIGLRNGRVLEDVSIYSKLPSGSIVDSVSFTSEDLMKPKDVAKFILEEVSPRLFYTSEDNS